MANTFWELQSGIGFQDEKQALKHAKDSRPCGEIIANIDERCCCGEKSLAKFCDICESMETAQSLGDGARQQTSLPNRSQTLAGGKHA